MKKIIFLLISLLSLCSSYAQTQDSLISPLIISISDENYEFEISKKKDVNFSIKCVLQNISDKEIIITRPYWRLNPYWIKIDSIIAPLCIGILNSVGYGIDTLKLKPGNKVDFNLYIAMDLLYKYNAIEPGTYEVSIKYDYNLEKIKKFYKVGFKIDDLPQDLEQLISKIYEANTGWSNNVNIKITETQKRKISVNKK